MATKATTTVSAEHIDEALRQRGQLTVRVNDSPMLFELTRRGVEVNAGGTRYVMCQARDIERDCITFRVKVDGRWECTATQGRDGVSHFEVIDKAGDPFGITGYTRGELMPTTTNEKRNRVLLLCQS
jgi:hypothetical protein